MMPVQQLAQRALDLVVAVLALLFLLPLLVVIALWVWCDRSGSILYAEMRVGRGGRPFPVYKFRTLRAGSAVEPAVAVAGDPRITGPGAMLRRWRLDELPQLVCLLAGTMSLVGPRPQTAAHLGALDVSSRERMLAVRPGMTSRAALLHLGEDDVLAGFRDPVHCYRTILLPAKVRMELQDLATWSLWQDLCVLLQTVRQLFAPGARRRSRRRVQELLERAGALPVVTPS
jgi:lipopolysaccharide/colanic/teichoic acid biosynthesis glycosyltransferase